jgi:hypothetical protein
MPQEQQCRKWSVCWKWGFIPYPCRKTYTCTCYLFSEIKCLKFGILCRCTACEYGVEYSWWEWCLGVGSATAYWVYRCYKEPKGVSGSCQNVVLMAPWAYDAQVRSKNKPTD